MRLALPAEREEAGRAAGEAGREVAFALKDLGARVEVLADPAPDLLWKPGGPLFLLGNLRDSRCVRELYFRFLCVTDLRYPGAGGYEIRTLLGCFGAGCDVVLLGYSDRAGLRKGLAALLARLRDPLPHLNEVSAAGLPIAQNDARTILERPLPEADWRIANDVLGDKKGYLAYLTGRQDLLADYVRSWEAVIRCGIERSEKIVQTHLFMLSRVAYWRLLELSGLMPEAVREPALRFIFDWAESGEGRGYLEQPCYQSPHFPRQNHGLLPALALLYAADLFSVRHPELPEPREWRRIGEAVFAPYAEGSWKPICDGLCHGWFLSQFALLEHGLLDRRHRYFESGGARRAADCAQAVVNNLGWMPSAGDGDLLRAFPGPSLRVAAAYYGEPAYRFVHDRAPEHRSLRGKWHVRSFETGLGRAASGGAASAAQGGTGGSGVRAAAGRAGLTVVPMDPLIYRVWEREPELAKRVTDTPPGAPIERCFDKISVRSGWKETDDYLLIDGLGGAQEGCTHSYPDAMGILDYSRLGVTALVSEDGLIWPRPEDHTVVTVARNGQASPMPSFAELEESTVDRGGNVTLRMRLRDYCGTDWVREVLLRPGACLVLRDTVTARKEGDYAVEAHFRVPAALRMREDRVEGCWRKDGRRVFAYLTGRCSRGWTRRIEELPIGLLYRRLEGEEPLSPEDDPIEAWRLRYGTEEPVLSAYTARCAVELREGESVTFTHLVQIAAAGERRIRWSDLEGRIEPGDAPAAPGSPGPPGLRPPACFAQIGHFPAPVSCLEVASDSTVLCGTQDGAVWVLDREGRILWRQELPPPIRAMAAIRGPASSSGRAARSRPGAPLAAVGCGAADLIVLDGAGRTVWRRTIRREPSPWPWWELATPAPVCAAAFAHPGEHRDEWFLAAGCGDIKVRVFDGRGELLWMRRYTGVPGRIAAADVDGDGIPEIVVGGEILSAVSTCCIYTPEGELKAELPVEGWTSRLTALTRAIATDGGDGAYGKTGERRHLLACGANRGWNLHLYDVTVLDASLPLRRDPANKTEILYAEGDARRDRHLMKARLGGEVVGVVLDPGASLLAAATTQGFLMAFDFRGRLRWRRPFTEGLQHLCRAGTANSRLFCADRTGGCFLVDQHGEIAVQWRLERPVQCVRETPDGLLATAGDRLYRFEDSDRSIGAAGTPLS